MTQGCVMTFNQGHISKVKVTVHTYPKSVSGQLLTTKLDLDISHAQGCVMTLTQGHTFKVKVTVQT